MATTKVMATTRVVLVVEDEALIQAMVEDALVEAGYEVVIAGKGRTGIEELEKSQGRFSCLVADIRLGTGPDGWKVGQRAREFSPHMPIVYITGDSAADWTSKGVPNSLILSKPFAVAQMVTAISSLLVQEDTRRAESRRPNSIACLEPSASR